MPETVISVQGSHTARYPAERATVSLSIAADGPDRDTVVAAVTAATDSVRASIEALSTPGPITRWSAESLRVWSERPWSQTGEQLDPVHHAAVDVTARFGDFGGMSNWIEQVVAVPQVAVGGIQWGLTEATTTGATAEVRSRAVKDAVAKATVYAQAIGLGSVTAIAIADPGMLGDGSVPQPMAEARFAMKMDAGGDGTALTLKPQHIEVSAAVDARFLAR